MTLTRLMLISLISTTTLIINAKVHEITSESEVKSPEKHKVVKFHAKWCPACVTFKDKFEELSNEYPDVDFYSVDTDLASDLASKHKISALPTILVFQSGSDEAAHTVMGGNKEKLKSAISSLPAAKPVTRSEVTEIKVETPTKANVKSGKVVEVKTKAEFDSLIKSDKPVVIELVKETCHFCKEIRPDLDTLAASHTDAIIAILDRDDVPEVIEMHQEHVRGYPTFVIYKNGKLDHAFTGATQKSLKPRISACLGKSDMQFVSVDDATVNKATEKGSAVTTSESVAPTKTKSSKKSKFSFGSKKRKSN